MPALGAKPGQVELTVSGYLIGFSIGQLLWGPVGDPLGRRLPIAIGLVLFIMGSAGCAMAQSVEALIAWRIVQAAGACAGVVLACAMVRDLYAGERAAQMMSTLMTVMAIAPLRGPLAGGQILRFAPWQAIFWFLTLVGFATLVAVWALPESTSASQLRPTAIDRKLGAGREGRIEREEEDGLGDFLRRPPALHRDHTDHLLRNPRAVQIVTIFLDSTT